MNRAIATLIGGALAFGATSANAAVFTYATDFYYDWDGDYVYSAEDVFEGAGEVVVDTIAETVTITSPTFNAIISDSDFASFSPDSVDTSYMNPFDDVSGTYEEPGYLWDLVMDPWITSTETIQPVLRFGDEENDFFYWGFGRDEEYAQYYPDYLRNVDLVGTNVTLTSSTSGETEIPEPGPLGLMGLGLAMMAFGAHARRRKLARG